MKKSLIALAALGVMGAASAQVTVFGVADVNVTQVSNPDDSVTGLSHSGNSSSRFGIRSTTEIENGLKVTAWLEGAVRSDGGNQAASATNNDPDGSTIDFARRLTVGLEGGFGEIRLGREHNAAYNESSAYDPFGDVGVGAALGNNYGGSRRNDGINYFLPKNLGGLFGQVTYAFGEDSTGEGYGDFFGARLGYSANGLTVSAGAGTLTRGTAPADTETEDSLSVGASYKIGDIVPVVRYSTSTLTAPAGDTELTSVLVGVTIGLGAGKVKVAYSTQDDEEDTISKVSLGYVHTLDKSLDLYAIYASGDEGVIGNKLLNSTEFNNAESGFSVGLTYKF